MVKVSKYRKKTPFRCAECKNSIGKDKIYCIEKNRDVAHYGWCGDFELKETKKDKNEWEHS